MEIKIKAPMKPAQPLSRTVTAHANRNRASTSKITKSIATRENFAEKRRRGSPVDTIPDSKGSFLLRPHALLPSTLESSNMKAHRPRTPKRKTANAQLWDSVETAASGMPALLGERLLFMRGALPRRMRLLYA